MAITLNGTTGISSPGGDTSTSLATTNLSYTGTLTGGTGVIAIGTTQIYKDASGNVGIGTSSPESNGSTYTTLSLNNATNGGVLSFLKDGVRQGLIFNTSTGGLIIEADVAGGVGSIIQFYTNGGGSERARIDSSGNLLVGTTSPSGNTRLYVTANGNNPAARFYGSGISDSQHVVYFDKPSTTNTTAQLFVGFTVNAQTTGNGQINGNGAGAAAFGSFSDSRLKENIAHLPDQLANICALKPSEFDYKDGTGHQIGFIAQEMQEVYPDVVGEGDDGMLTITGWSKTEARLVKAIQELTTRLEALEAK